MKFTKDLRDLLSDERGRVSSKRAIAVIIVIELCFLATISCYKVVTVNDTIITTLGAICVGAMASSSADKFSKKTVEKPKEDDSTE